MIDDDQDDQLILLETLQDLAVDHELTLANTGHQALNLLDKLYAEDKLPCMVLLDLNMPVLNGIQTLQLIRADCRFKNLQVSIYSTSLNPTEKNKAIELGIAGYEIKPASFDEAAVICRRLLVQCNCSD